MGIVIIIGLVLFVLYTIFSSEEDTKNRISRDDLYSKPSYSVANPSTLNYGSSIKSKINKAILNNSDIIITYNNYRGESSTRRISNIIISNEFTDRGYLNEHIKGFCHLRNENRTFKISRITSVTEV